MGAIIYLYRRCHKINLCNGFEYATHCFLYLFIHESHFYVPIKQTSTPGYFHMFIMEGEPDKYNQKLLMGCVTNLLTNVKVLDPDKPIHIHQSMSVALKDKMRVYRVIFIRTYNIYLMIKQGATWYPLKVKMLLYIQQ